MISEELLTKLVFWYDDKTSLSAVEDAEDEEHKSAKGVDLDERTVSFLCEGKEGALWHEYMDAK